MAKTFILSDETVNSYGFRVLTAGIDVKQFKKNPVMFFNHRSWGENYSGPIGRWENIRVEDGKLMADAVFDETDEFAQKIAKKVEGGFIKGASIGFSAIESSVDPAVLTKGQTRPTVTRSLLFEASVVDLPSNVNALALYDSSGNLIELKSGDAEPLNQLLPIIHLKKEDMNVKLATATLAILCLGVDATEAQIDEAVKKLSEERDAFKTKLDSIAEDRAKALVSSALAAKKIKESEQAEWLELAKTNPSLAESTLGKLSVPKLPMGNIKEDKTKDQPEWTLKDWREKDPEGLSKMRKEDPEAYAALAKANLKAVTGK